MMNLEMMGRELLSQELNGITEMNETVETRSGFTQTEKKISCTRCGSFLVKDRVFAPCLCGEGCFYCLSCLQMGKVKKCSTLYYKKEENLFADINEPVLMWKGTLSPQQQEASKEILATINQGGERLVWAVAGAGKTEMLFQGIAQALKDKKRVCLASPRVDVCLELAPRIQHAFSQTELIVLHGSMEETYRYTQLVIATTHQLMRFREAFDVLIIDEIDAFPFHLDDSLQFAAQKARQKNGALIYLSATPSAAMRKLVQKQQLQASILPARYHGYPLPVPAFMWTGDWKKKIQNQKKKGRFFKIVREMLKANRRFLIFVPNIDLMHELATCLNLLYPSAVFTSVYAEDPERKEKVLMMRQEKLDFLLTTTILERGVTFRDIDVLVLGAEDKTFTEAALVQISGRAGRHKDYPTGKVIFFHYGQSREMKQARKQIMKMNRLAYERGLIHQ